MELPLLATNWSGPTEFMTEENAFPIAIEDALVPVGKGFSNFSCFHYSCCYYFTLPLRFLGL